MGNEAKVAKPGRPPKSPEGKRVTVHLSLSPEASRALKALCDRPISPIPESTMVEHLIMQHASAQPKR